MIFLITVTMLGTLVGSVFMGVGMAILYPGSFAVAMLIFWACWALVGMSERKALRRYMALGQAEKDSLNTWKEQQVSTRQSQRNQWREEGFPSDYLL